MFGPLHLDAKQWTPHAYQARAVDFLLSHDEAALWADPGLGKTSICLEAFRRLKEQDSDARMLVVAPLLPATEVWPYEVRKWRQFQHMSTAVLHGPNKLKMLRTGALTEADVTVMNYEGLAWLLKYADDAPDYAVIVADEITKLKNATAQRSKAWRKLFWSSPRRWGLTGTPAPNGYEDLFGQMLALDKGRALGKTMSEFRNRYYTPHPYMKYEWQLVPGAVERIEEQIAPITLRMAAEDYLDLPERIDDVRKIHMTPALEKQYKELKKEMLLAIPEGAITAANAAALYSKLAQLANGAVYTGEDSYTTFHDIKLDALEELREELGQEQLLVAYEFRHDLFRIKERFGEVAVLSSQMPRAERAEIIARWNSGELKTLFMHPAAAGHGLNLQGSSARHICWFSATWNLELYEQTIARLLRQGNEASTIINHILALAGTIDELKIAALADKDADQERLLQGLKQEFEIDTGEETMAIRKLGQPRQDEQQAAAPASAPQATTQAASPSWGPKTRGLQQTVPEPAAAQSDDMPESGSPEHLEQVRNIVTTGSAKSAFSAGVQAKLGAKPTPPAAAGPKAQQATEPETVKPDVKPVQKPQGVAPAPAASGELSRKDRLDAIVAMFSKAVDAALGI